MGDLAYCVRALPTLYELYTSNDSSSGRAVRASCPRPATASRARGPDSPLGFRAKTLFIGDVIVAKRPLGSPFRGEALRRIIRCHVHVANRARIATLNTSTPGGRLLLVRQHRAALRRVPLSYLKLSALRADSKARLCQH
jgi:hypothetical protein